MSENHLRPQSALYEQAPVSDVEAESSATDFAEETPERKEYVPHGTFNKDGWGLEILSLLVSLALFIGMVAIFFTMQNKPLSKWHTWPFSIDITTAISILATGCTAAMMHNVSAFISQLKWIYFEASPRQLYNIERFDEASRGPYGSVFFLFRVPWNMATFGALITILRLGFAPFSQQVISLQPKEVNIQNDATISENATTFGFAHAYDRNINLNVNFTNITVDTLSDPQMQSAILQGFFNISTVPLFNCSGLCRWEGSYVSLGFKSLCKDVTTSTRRTESCAKREDGRFDEPIEDCNLTTPKGVTLTTHRMQELQTMFRINATSKRYDAFSEDDLIEGDIINDIGELATVAVYRSEFDNNSNMNSQLPNITECTIDLTAYKYVKAQANGTTFSFETVHEIGFQNTSWACKGDPPICVNKNSTTANIPQFTLNLIDFLALQRLFDSPIFQSERVAGKWAVEYTSTNIGLFNGILHGSADLSRTFDNVAKRMTDCLRSGPNMQLATGIRVKTEIFVLVRWQWLIGPGLLELAALIFAVCTINNARKRKVPLWKSSALVLLTCKYDADVGQIHGAFKDVKDLERMAKASKARLQ